MPKFTTHDHLEHVYQETSVDQVAKSYDDWADTYDDQMGASGYRHPSICLALIARYVPRDAGRILDAGVGTGLLGDWLCLLGYAPLEGLDVSPGMLAVAEKKGAYDQLHEGALGETLPFEDGRFAAAVAAGVFTPGHAGPEGLDELLRVVRSSGHLVVTVKDKLYQNGLGARLKALVEANRCVVVDRTPSYISIPNESGMSTSHAMVLRRC